MPSSESSGWIMRVVLIVIAAAILFALVTYYSRPMTVVQMETPERFMDQLQQPKPVSTMPVDMPRPSTSADKPSSADVNAVIGTEPINNEDYKAVDYDTRDRTADNQACFPRDKLTAEDLLPKDAANSKWAQVNPAGQGDVQSGSYLTAGYHIGINTVGQTLRNPNYQIRSEPPNPKAQVSPWNMTTIEYDVSRRHLEIGEC